MSLSFLLAYFFDGLGQLDLAAWGIDEHSKVAIESVLQGREMLKSVRELLPMAHDGGKHSVGIDLALAFPGLLLVLARGIWGLLKFLIGVGVLAAVVSMTFYVVENQHLASVSWANQFSTKQEAVQAPPPRVFILPPVERVGKIRR